MRYAPSILGALAALAATATAGPDAADRIKGFDEHPDLAPLTDRWSGMYEMFEVPGFSIVVVDGGEVYGHFWGRRDLEGAPVDADTMFYIASVTKTHTAAGVCKLAGEGRVDLDAPVKRYLPRFELASDEATASVTVRDLLCHRAGINDTPIVLLDAYTGEITEDRFYHFLAEVEPVEGPVYSNEHFTIAGRVIEAVTGLPWRDYLEREVFLPAGMTRTTGYASRMYEDANAAMPMGRAEGRFVLAPRKSDSVMHAAGGLGTTGRDAARWMLLTLDGGEIGGTRVLSEALVREMQTLHAEHEETRGSIRIEQGYGLAWTVGHYGAHKGGHKMLSHGGGYLGTSAYFSVLPERGAGVALMTNSAELARGFADIAVIDVLEALTGEPPAWDVYENYRGRLDGGRPTFQSFERRLLEVDAILGVPIAQWAGVYTNEWYGTLTLTAEPEGLSVSLGGLELRVEAVEDGFRITGPTFDGTVVKEPEMGPGGDIVALTAVQPADGVIRFERRR